jgi:hypothetical protein
VLPVPLLWLAVGQDVEIDEAPSVKELRKRAIEARTEVAADPTETVAIDAGETLFFRVKVPVRKGVPLDGTIDKVRAPKGVSIVPWVEVAGGFAIYGIQADRTVASTDLLEGEIILRDREGNPVGRKALLHEIAPRRSAPTAEIIALDRDAYLHHQAIAASAYERLQRLHDFLRLDQFVRPPSAQNVPADRTEDYLRFMHHRLRADAAERRLRAAAGSSDEAIEVQAIQAIGALSRRPSGPAKMARAIDGVTTTDALAITTKALEDLRIDEAEGFLDKLRNGGRLTKEELAEALIIAGAIRFARGAERDAAKEMGRAFCIIPELGSAPARRAFAKLFAEAKAATPCKEPIEIREVKVEHAKSGESLVYRITAEFGDDPFGLITGGDVQLWGSGGEIFAGDQVRTTDVEGRRFLVGEVRDSGNMETFGGQILVKAFVKDVSGVVIASFGHPDPKPLPIERHESLPAVDIPWWVWVVVAGGVAVAAGTTTAIVLGTREREAELGIGPIEVTF